MLASIAILTLFGILLIMLETFLPGWVAGILGTLAIFIAIWLALTSQELAGWSSNQRTALVVGILVIAMVVLILWLLWIADMVCHGALTLTTSIETPVAAGVALGTKGVAFTELRPLGRAEFDGQRYEVRCQNGLAAAGTHVEVIAAEPGNLLVRIL